MTSVIEQVWKDKHRSVEVYVLRCVGPGGVVGVQVEDQIKDQIRDQALNQVRDQVWDQIWNQVRK